MGTLTAWLLVLVTWTYAKMALTLFMLSGFIDCTGQASLSSVTHSTATAIST